MDTLKQDLILTTVEVGGNKYTQMNMPIKEVCYRSGVAGFKLYDKLEEMGIKVEHALLLSQQDVDDYNDYGRLHRGINPFNHEESKLKRTVLGVSSCKTFLSPREGMPERRELASQPPRAKPANGFLKRKTAIQKKETEVSLRFTNFVLLMYNQLT